MPANLTDQSANMGGTLGTFVATGRGATTLQRDNPPRRRRQWAGSPQLGFLRDARELGFQPWLERGDDRVCVFAPGRQANCGVLTSHGLLDLIQQRDLAQHLFGDGRAFNTVPLAPLINGLCVCRENDPLDRFLILRTPEAFRERRSGITAGLDCGPNLRRRCRLLVKMNQHGGSPSRSSLRTDLAMKSADRRGEM